MRVSLGRRIAIQGALALLLVLAIPFAARAAGEEEIRNYIISIDRLYESLDYERALNRIQLARQVPRGTKEEVTLSLYEGIILCEMGKQGPGTSAFKSALFLRPDAQLPVQVAPKVEQLFESVRKQVKREMTPFLEQHKPKSQPDKTELVRESTPAPRATGPSTPAAKMEVPTNPAPPTVAPVMPNAEARSSPMAPKQESRADTVQTPSSGCQAAVSIECERLLKRLLQLQEKFLRTGASLKLGPIQALAKIAQQLRAARTLKTLQEAAQALDDWEQQQGPIEPAPAPTPSPVAPKQESRADTVQTDTSSCQEAVSTGCERLLKRLLQLQEEFLRTTAFLKLGPIEELAEIARQIRAARTSEELQEAAQSLDSWKQQHLSQ